MEVTLKVFRFNPEKDKKPRFQEYRVTVDRYTRVLEALLWVKENVDPSLSFRYSCRMAMCGSCAMLINGKPRLACKTIIGNLKTSVIELRPLPKFNVVRDLVVEMSDFFENHRSVKPYLIREDVEEQENPTNFYLQTPEELQKYVRFAYCIMCGLCSASCPIFKSGGKYLGPQAIAQAYRYILDSRDEGLDARREILNSEEGVWHCHFAGECSEACPKGVEPAEAIQRLRRLLL
uniref:succinate dehydrogenase n=1 Tax=Geoglobus ahangari TaxID=113653 RepID=A0A7C4WBT7_9EURY